MRTQTNKSANYSGTFNYCSFADVLKPVKVGLLTDSLEGKLRMTELTDWHIENWLPDLKINEIEYSQYWNDEEKEKSKEWYILDGDFLKMERYLKTTGLLQDLRQCIEVLHTDLNRQIAGIGIDLAAGNLWAAPYLLNVGTVNKLYCIEYSKHRLLKIGPAVLDHYGIPKEKVVLAIGSFYDLHVDDQSFDFVFMSQAFHHADDPKRLLEEICRVLKPCGVVIIIGEHIVNYRKAYIKHFVKFLISTFMPEKLQKKIFNKTFNVEKLIASPREIYAPDPVLGDHYYTDAEYNSMFSKYGFRIKHVRNHHSRFQSFVLIRA